jgi:hypothetical protein
VSDTPKTDALYAEIGDRTWDRPRTYIPPIWEFARQLERENRDLLEALKRLCELARQFCYDGEDSASMDRAEGLPAVQQARAAITKAEAK